MKSILAVVGIAVYTGLVSTHGDVDYRQVVDDRYQVVVEAFMAKYPCVVQISGGDQVRAVYACEIGGRVNAIVIPDNHLHQNVVARIPSSGIVYTNIEDERL